MRPIRVLAVSLAMFCCATKPPRSPRVAPAAAPLASTSLSSGANGNEVAGFAAVAPPLPHPPRPPLNLDAVEPLQLSDAELDDAVQRDDVVALMRALKASGVAAAGRHGLLHAAAEADAHECIAVLVQAGASLSAVDEDHQTALHIAVANGNVAATDALTEILPCAELHLTDKYKMAPLHLACEGRVAQSLTLTVTMSSIPHPHPIRIPIHKHKHKHNPDPDPDPDPEPTLKVASLI